MQHSTLRQTRTMVLTVVAVLFLTVGPSAEALTPLSDAGLAETHAASGIRLTFEDVNMGHSADEMRYIAHENEDSLGHLTGTEDTVGVANLGVALGVDGALDVKATSFAFDEQDYFATDVWKTDDFEHVFKTHTLSKTPQFNGANRQVVVVEALGGLANPFLTVESVQGNLQAVYRTDTHGLGTLGVSNAHLIDQRTILYAMPEIQGHCAGEGIALELGMRLSVESLKIHSDTLVDPDPEANGNKLALFEMRGVHLRESFDDDWLVTASDDSTYHTPQSPYDYLGKRKSIAQVGPGADEETRRMYAYSTADPNGYSGAGDQAALEAAYGIMSGGWGTTEPSPTVSVDNMYGGRFMIGNLRQVGFDDYIAGNKEVPAHWNHADQLEWNDRLELLGWDNQEYSLTHRVDDADRVDYAEIIERPMTLSLKKRTHAESPDESQCVVLNMPLHGSVRVAQVLGYNLGDAEKPHADWSNSMGPLVIEGLRVKKLYIEFPGRNKKYKLRTAVAEGLDYPNAWHDYWYTPGRLPTAQIIPEAQKEYNPMGRGVEEFMNRMGPDPVPPTCPEAEKPGWDQYRTRLGANVYEGETLVRDNSFWQIREPYPINGDFSDYYTSGYD